ncbi:PaaI family thioesterase [Nocardioides sp.]|uniref:PaaI family thioesterase n=1 Tax=Nocardioides sp. TaxID=35761 RepID=UPI002734D50D|nr:PaaI family thioesterase [Nocardioides sp.]MDP3893429.1 PaaI family thioesterase [Nocardioides sp.]
MAEHVFDARHVGAPGIAHGGAVATVMDDLFGFLLYVVGTLAVTRTLQVEYRAPVLLGERYSLRADLLRREGRRLYMEATMRRGDTVVAAAQAVFVAVEHTHFSDSVGVQR